MESRLSPLGCLEDCRDLLSGDREGRLWVLGRCQRADDPWV